MSVSPWLQYLSLHCSWSQAKYFSPHCSQYQANAVGWWTGARIWNQLGLLASLSLSDSLSIMPCSCWYVAEASWMCTIIAGMQMIISWADANECLTTGNLHPLCQKAGCPHRSVLGVSANLDGSVTEGNVTASQTSHAGAANCLTTACFPAQAG